jgi:orotate phosphoribosyltransferase
VIDLVDEWNKQLESPCLGFVVGGTDLISLKRVREKSPESWILCPGIGFQGGDAKEACNVGLRKSDGSGLLISISRAISKSSNMSETAKTLVKEINEIRNEFLSKNQKSENPAISSSSSTSSTVTSLQSFQKEFISFVLDEKVLQFGSFTLKSGRLSPYFFNAGLLCHGKSLAMLSKCYAKAVKESGLEFDIIFGPAYKGIPLVTAFAMSWYELYHESKDICYNRKEMKDHGEGGLLVGASIAGRKVLIIDDVITAGTAIREALEIIQGGKGIIVGVIVCLDRQEKANETTNESAIQQVEKEYHFPVYSVIKLDHLISYILTELLNKQKENDQNNSKENQLLYERIQEYRRQYGV